jgi:hypothetical protein
MGGTYNTHEGDKSAQECPSNDLKRREHLGDQRVDGSVMHV